MLSKGFRDEEQERLSELFNSGLELEFVPGLWENQQRKQLDKFLQKAIEKTLDQLEELSTENLLQHLKAHHLSFSNYEQFGDLLLKVIPFEAKEHRQNLAQKALAVYEFAQQESKTFSFGLIQKIETAKAKL